MIRGVLVLSLLLLTQFRAVASPEAGGIAWYAGDVESAFSAAHSSNKLVLLYWGAKWCPPCQQLKSSVFTRQDFIEKSKQFVAVYLDGDDAGAQKWGERFHVAGYPTVVILRPDQGEVSRLSGGADLSVYADLLDTALSDVKPFQSVLNVLHQRTAALSAADCRRLAYYPWEENSFLVTVPKAMAADLESAAQRCDHLSSVEHARLIINSAALATAPATTRQVIAIVHDPVLSRHLVDVLENLTQPFYDSVRAEGAPVSQQFEADWVRTMDETADDPAVTDADQLYAIGTELSLIKRFSIDAKVPAQIAQKARTRVVAALGKHVDPYVRSGIVNSADFIYEVLDDQDAEYRLLNGEVTTAAAPYYYMADLAELEEKRGNKKQALDWYERAYRQSTGPATRFQWGFDYLSALLRLAPEEDQRIRKVGFEVIAELDGPDRIHARTRARLGRLDAGLRDWNGAHRHEADIADLRRRMQGICSRLPRTDSGRDSCLKFLS